MANIKENNVKMVNISEKKETKRTAIACGLISLSQEAINLITVDNSFKKEVLAITRIAGIMAAKRTYDFIPLCHQLIIDMVDVKLILQNKEIKIISNVISYGRTGVEMEALTAVSASALTLYDMIKSTGKSAIIKKIYLLEKRGGKSGDYYNKI